MILQLPTLEEVKHIRNPAFSRIFLYHSIALEILYNISKNWSAALRFSSFFKLKTKKSKIENPGFFYFTDFRIF